MNNKRRITLFQHWTRAYFTNLLIGVMIISGFAVFWMQLEAKAQNSDKLKVLGEELAMLAIDDNGQFHDDRSIHQNFERIQRVLELNKAVHLLVVDAEHNRIFPPPNAPAFRTLPSPANRPGESAVQRNTASANTNELSPLGPKLYTMLDTLPQVQQVQLSTQSIEEYGEVYLVQAPIVNEARLVGEVLLAMTHKAAARVPMNYSFLLSLIGGMLLLGWGTIYFLTKRLIRPLEEVAVTANALKEGHYDVKFNSEIKEKEVYDMVTAIETMAEKLKHLEALRTVLFAGVTHELKTPIASVSGMVQAVKDNLVQDEERDEFLKLSIQETQRLQRMVEDLLDFNGIAIGELKAKIECVKLATFVKEVVHQWKMALEHHQELDIRLEYEGCPDYVWGDPVRIQQILINLLNNALHALQDKRSIQVRLYDHGEGFAGIDVQDRGKGIPEEDRPYIFERFYRGSNKKYRTRGLGLGLPFSLMMAKVQNGSLYLNRSSTEGTVFTLILPMPK